jgi:hypothetical protein
MTDAQHDKDETVEPDDLLRHSRAAIGMRSTLIRSSSDAVAMTSALTVQWLDMNRKLLDRARKRLEVVAENIEEADRTDAPPMSYYERSEKFQGVAMENAKDCMQQFERFALGAQVLMQRMAERYGPDLAAEPPKPDGK